MPAVQPSEHYDSFFEVESLDGEAWMRFSRSPNGHIEVKVGFRHSEEHRFYMEPKEAEDLAERLVRKAQEES